MNPFLKALLLGILQGVSEFLPISSSGHLMILDKLLHFSHQPLSLILLLHGATLLSIGLIFFKDFKNLKLQRKDLFLKTAVALIPLFALGLFLKNLLQDFSIQGVALGFLGTGVLFIFLIFIKPKKTLSLSQLSLKQAFLIGLSQTLAVLPGFSRSGWTISTGMLLGLNPKDSAVFSFIIAIPAILASLSYYLVFENFFLEITSPHLLAFFTAFLTGCLSLLLLLRMLQRNQFYFFSFYLIPLGVFLLFFPLL